MTTVMTARRARDLVLQKYESTFLIKSSSLDYFHMSRSIQPCPDAAVFVTQTPLLDLSSSVDW